MAVAISGPPQGGQGRRVLTIKPGERWQVRFLGDLLVTPPRGIWLHPWVEQLKRAKPCTGDGCQWCAASIRQTWRNYAPVRARRFVQTGSVAGGEVFGAFGDVAEYALELWDANVETLEGYDLRGLMVELTRGDKFKPPRLDVLEVPETEPPTLPRSFDVRPVLCRFWGEPKAFDDAAVEKPKLKVWGA